MGKLVEIKTKATDDSVDAFIQKIENEQKREDSITVMKMMQKATKESPKIWSNSMIGFGEIVVTSPATGRSVNWLKIGFAPRKANITIYFMDMTKFEAELKVLGKHKLGGGCLYINKLSDVDTKVLEKMIQKCAAEK